MKYKTDFDSRDAKSRPEPCEPGSNPGAGDSPSRLALPANCPFRRCILRVIKKHHQLLRHAIYLLAVP